MDAWVSNLVRCHWRLRSSTQNVTSVRKCKNAFTRQKMCTLHCTLKVHSELQQRSNTSQTIFFLFVKLAYKDTFCNMTAIAVKSLIMFSVQTCYEKKCKKVSCALSRLPEWHLGRAREKKKLGVNQGSRTKSQSFLFPLLHQKCDSRCWQCRWNPLSE